MMKNLFHKLLLLAALAVMATGFTGCFNANADDSEIPWTRPHSWENQAPGMGGMGGNTF